jgi:hypothetical protein
MKIPDDQIENLLRRAPQPQPPKDLKERLIMQTQPPAGQPRQTVIPRTPDNWFRRWWPTLAPVGVSLFCVAVLAVQQKEIRELKLAIQASAANASARNAVSKPEAEADSSGDLAAREREEIGQLKETIARLTSEISQLEQMRSESQKLRAQLAAPPAGMLTPEQMAEVEKALERAMRITCVNNLKQMGLAALMWAGDNNDVFPPNIVCMSNELSTPKFLVCPADTGRQVAPNFSAYTDANCSNEHLAPNAPAAESARVLFRCPIHQNIGLCDGSVQQIDPAHPEWVVLRDGKYYLEGAFKR